MTAGDEGLGSVDRVQDHGDPGTLGTGDARLLAHDGHAGSAQHVERGPIGDEVDRVLARLLGPGPPLAADHGGDGVHDAGAREGGDHFGAEAELRKQIEAAMMQFHDLLHDGQAEAGALFGGLLR